MGTRIEVTTAYMDILSRLRAGIPQIVARYQELTNRPPWTSLSESERIDHLPELLEDLLDADPSASAIEPLIREAVTHGSHRRVQLFTPETILEEYHALRRAMWDAASADATSREAVPAIVQVDARISIATLGSLHGLFRADPENEPWDDLVAELMDSWKRTRHR
jgi:hypothetical protein